MTWFDLPDDEEAAYDAPFPSRIYMAGPRTFPSLVNEVPGHHRRGMGRAHAPSRSPSSPSGPPTTRATSARAQPQQHLIDSVPGAAGQPHDRLPEASHFLQDDQGTEIATRLVDWYATVSGSAPSGTDDPATSPTG